jgi:DNA-directed RNA polymerase subunit RPC12/RpoP
MDSYKQDTSGNRNDYLSLTKELYTLQNQLRMASIRLGDSNPIPHRLVRKNLSTSNAICSSCGAQFEYIQKNKFGTIKEINCKLCGTRFLSRCVSENNFQIEPLRDVEESSVCPSCNAPISLKLSNKPGSLVDLMCANCSLPLSASRAKEGFKIRVKNSLSIVSSQPPEAGPVSQMPSPHPPEISPEIIQAVKEAMPPQPWPVDAHKEVASRLKLDAYTVRRAINQLIKCGDFKLQLDSELFDLSPSK